MATPTAASYPKMGQKSDGAEVGRLRRCASLSFHADKATSFDLGALLAGGTGVKVTNNWLAMAPHLDAPVELSTEQLALLVQLSPDDWTTPVDDTRFATLDITPLVDAGLIIVGNEASGPVEDAADHHSHGWWMPAAMAHRMSLWQGVDSASRTEEMHGNDVEAIRNRRGSAPSPIRNPRDRAIALPVHCADGFDEQLAMRATCRNFDTERAVSLEQLSRMLKRSLGAQHVVEYHGEIVTLKKHVPSGGGFHSVEGYLLARNVEGLAPGLYHYDAIAHSLAALPSPDMPLDEFAKLIVAGQQWFADSPVMLILAPHFARCHWKYHNNPKAYRVTVLDTGHISQLLFHCAQQEGLGGFVTAAINELDIEHALGFDGLEDSPTAIFGFGWRAQKQVEPELDPGEHVWKQVGPSTVQG